MLSYPLFWVGIPLPTIEHGMGSQRPFQKNKKKKKNWCWTCCGATWFGLVLRVWGIFLYFEIFLIHVFECGSKIGIVEGCILGGGVGDVSHVCTIRGCATGSTLRVGAGVLDIFGGRIFLFWIYGNIGGNSNICKWSWAVLLCKMWAIRLITFLHHHSKIK